MERPRIPKPRIDLVLHAGVLAPNAKLRKKVVAHARPAIWSCPLASLAS